MREGSVAEEMHEGDLDLVVGEEDVGHLVVAGLDAEYRFDDGVVGVG